VVYTDNNENKRVVKEKQENKKVDGIIASIIAMNEYCHTLGSDDIMLEILDL
jgi:phage terminase large subunit-like protein